MKCFSVLLFVCLNVIAVCSISDLDQNLINAAEKGYVEEIKTLIKNGANVNATNNNKDTPLHWAAINGHTEAVKTLIEKGANVNATNNNKDTSLHLAAINGDTEAVKTLIEKGANVNATNNNKDTPLHWAAFNGHTKAIKTLIEKGANVNATNNNKNTPLHWAASNGDTEAVETLIEKGANVNATNNNKNTPLHRAADYGQTEAIKALIANGANWFAKNDENKTPYQLASETDRKIFTDAMPTLFEKAAIERANLHNYKINKEIIEATKKRIYDEVDRAISDLGNSNLTDKFNQMKQDSLKEFDEKKSGGNEISNSFREQLNVNLNDFHTSLAFTLQIYAHCIRKYSDSMQKSLDENEYYEQTEFENLHKNTKNEAIVQFVTEAQIIGDISASILRNVERVIKEKFRNFQEINNGKKNIDKINAQNSVICDHLKTELKENITRDIENIDLHSGSNDLDDLFKRSKEAAMIEFDMRKAGNEDISKSIREKLETDLNNFRNDLFETMAKYQNYLDQYSNVMGNAINSSTSFLNENQLTDTHKRAKNESVSQFKPKLSYDELNLRFKQVLEKSIEEKFSTFAVENGMKKDDFFGNNNLRKNLTEAAKMEICNNELFDLHKFNLTDRFNQIIQDSMNEFDSKKRGQNEIANVFLRLLLDKDLNDFHNSLATTLKNYRDCMKNRNPTALDSKKECIDYARNNAESHLFGCTNINKKDTAKILKDRKNTAYGDRR